MKEAGLELDDIQGDILLGLQKNAEAFLFFRILELTRFKRALKQYGLHRITNTVGGERCSFVVSGNRG